MNVRPKIYLTQQSGRWLARFVDDEDVLAMFHTDTLPTSFTKNDPLPDVVNKMHLLNPLHDIIVQKGA